MKTSIIEVTDMLSVLTVDEVEKRIRKVPGVESATVNYSAGNVTVRYDETLLNVADIKVLVHQRRQQSAGEFQAKSLNEDKPKHKPKQTPEVKPTPEAAPASASPPKPAMPKVAPATASKPTAPAGHGQQDKGTAAAPPSTPVAAKEG